MKRVFAVLLGVALLGGAHVQPATGATVTYYKVKFINVTHSGSVSHIIGDVTARNTICEGIAPVSAFYGTNFATQFGTSTYPNNAGHFDISGSGPLGEYKLVVTSYTFHGDHGRRQVCQKGTTKVTF